MKRSRFSEDQIIGILKEHQAGMTAVALCRKHGISDATFYKWRSKYGGMEVSDVSFNEVMFDVDDDGFRERTSWAALARRGSRRKPADAEAGQFKRDDAFLVIDLEARA